MSAIKNIGHVFHVSRTKKFKDDEVSKSSLALGHVKQKLATTSYFITQWNKIFT